MDRKKAEKRIEAEAPAGGREILSRLREAGFCAYFVGGCVRDALLGLSPADWDIASSARPEEVRALFPGARILPTGLRHGTLTLLSDRPYEITTFRTEGRYGDGRRPDRVAFTRSLEEDLSRRDFTVNALAWSPERGIVDLFSGLADLEGRVLRCVGDPEKRLSEDALRILRGLRFYSVYRLAPEAATAAAMRALRGRLSVLSAERKEKEFCLALSGRYAGEAFSDFPDLLTALFPALEGALPGLSLLDRLSPEPEERTAFLFFFAGEETLTSSLRETRFPRRFCERALLLRRAAHAAPPRDRLAMRRFLAGTAPDCAEAAFRIRFAALGDAETLRARELLARLRSENALPPRREELAVSGETLISHGLAREGPEVGCALSLLYRAVVDGEAENSEKALLSYYKRRGEP